MQNLKRGINKMKKKLLEILAEVCDEDAIAETDDMDIDLVAEDLIDSMGFVELLVAIEENFGIVIAPSEYTKDEFNTPQKILDILEKLSGNI